MVTKTNLPPSKDEAEISIFGPGIGECILMHIGDNEWIIIDSCIEKKSRLPIALKYLEQLGVDVAASVKLFAITHWHDDHINGASNILAACPSANFVCSAALNSTEFIAFTKSHSTRSLSKSSGADEFNQILEELKKRAKGIKPRDLGPNQWAIADNRLLNLPNKNRSFHVKLYALSPSHTTVTRAIREFGQLLPTSGTTKRRAIAQQPNDVSVVLWVTMHKLHILLGSDLENLPNDRVGWRAILYSQNKPLERAFIAKVPHHGSSRSYCREMWTQMVASNPIALLTPKSSGKTPLPSETDIKNIRKHASSIFSTGTPAGWKPHRRDRSVERTIKEIVRTHRSVHGPMGHVQVRFFPRKESGSISIKCFNGAQSL